MKTSIQSPENLSKLLRAKSHKKLLKANRLKSPRLPETDNAKPQIFDLEDEDMVQREDSFISEEFILQNDHQETSRDLDVSRIMSDHY